MGHSLSSPRPASLMDLDALVHLEQDLFEYDQLKRSSFRRFILSPNDLWVIDEGDKLLGYVLVLKRKGSLKARVYSLAVSPAAQGQGLGRRLLTHAMEELKGFKEIRLEVKVDNEGAIKLYQSLGFQKRGRISQFYSDGQDAFVFQKVL